MGMESDIRKEIRLTELRKTILSLVEFAGVMSLAVMMPKVVTLVAKLQNRREERVKSALKRLIEKGLLENTREGFRLTAKGTRLLQVSSLHVSRPKKWDKKWRMVIFDIPERLKTKRDLLRRTLIEIGFLRLQNSVWVFPFDCEDLITLLKTDFRIGKDVLYMIVDRIENDRNIREHFNLTDPY